MQIRHSQDMLFGNRTVSDGQYSRTYLPLGLKKWYAVCQAEKV